MSKVDHWGAGAARSLVCICGVRGRFSFPCVACRVEEQLAARQAQGAGQDDPLFPDEAGRFPTKEGSTRTLAIVFVPLEGRITGHSPRRMGAQLLAGLGIEEVVICWFGRWGSSTVRAYIEDARARSRAGRRIWADALTADAAPGAAAGAAPCIRGLTAQHLGESKAAAPMPRPRVATTKTFVLNTETRRMHIVGPGESRSLCHFLSLDMPTALLNPELQGVSFRGKEVEPCVRCRRLAQKRGMLSGGRAAGTGGGSSSSEASEESAVSE